MEESAAIFVALIVTILLSWAVAEFFGRAKHIGFGWTFALTATTAFVGGIIALIASPSADKPAPPRRKGQAIAAWIFFIFGGLGLFTLNPLSLGFLVLGAYIWGLSKGEIKNSNPKFYFRNFSTTPKKSKNSYSNSRNRKSQEAGFEQHSEPNFDEQKDRIKNLFEKEILSFSEYQEKLQKIEKSENQFNLRESVEYHQLEELKRDGLLTEEEFQEKITKLKNKSNSKNSSISTTIPPINAKLISFKGYQKAKQIYYKALTEDSSTMMNNLMKRFEEIFKIEGGDDSKLFVEEVIAQLEGMQDIKIMSPFKDHIALIMDSQMNYGYIDNNYDFIAKPKFQFAEEFWEDLALVRLDDKFGYINAKGETAISFLYDDATAFENGRAKVKIGKKNFQIDKKGNRVRF